jgi:hypothetical protein
MVRPGPWLSEDSFLISQPPDACVNQGKSTRKMCALTLVGGGSLVTILGYCWNPGFLEV